MSGARGPGLPRACAECLRRGWLLGELSPVLDRNCRADGRLLELLALGDHELIAALGGRRRSELRRRYERFAAGRAEAARGSRAICRHDDRYPRALRGPGGPRLLHVAGGLGRLQALASGPAVALLGTGDASDYGMRVARELGRALAASGVALVTERRPGIALGAQLGALEGRGATIQISGHGLGARVARSRRATYERLAPAGCAISELPGAVGGRSWGAAAGVRIAAALGGVCVIVEARDGVAELRGARLARALDRPVAAVPGPVSSTASAGCHALLRDGARLVRGAADVLDLLYGLDGTPAAGRVAGAAVARLAPGLRELLRRVGAGADTLGELTAGSPDPAGTLRDLSELELLGLLDRGDGGRYAIACPPAAAAVRYGGDAQMES